MKLFGKAKKQQPMKVVKVDVVIPEQEDLIDDITFIDEMYCVHRMP